MRGLVGLPARLFRNEDGATAIEYAFLGALLAVAIIGSLIAVGGEVRTQFTSVAEGFPEED